MKRASVVLAIALVSCGGGYASSPYGRSELPSTNSVVDLNGFVEFAVPVKNAGPFDIRLGPGGNLWFTQDNAASIGRIDAAGKIVEYTIPAPAMGIAAGPDGNMWFTEPHAVGRMAPNGSFELFDVPALCSGCSTSRPLQGIAAGPDGALWFGAGANQGLRKHYALLRVTTGGKFTVFPNDNAASLELTAGPDEAVWQSISGASSNDNHVGRSALSGAFSSYGAFVDLPLGITVGPDHALWFAELGTGTIDDGKQQHIGRITTSGLISEYAIPTPDSEPYFITVGSDGNLWFGESNAHKIGRITTHGLIAEFALGAGRDPEGITAGPNGTIWFTEFAGNKIARFVP